MAWKFILLILAVVSAKVLADTDSNSAIIAFFFGGIFALFASTILA